jgi:hypothetical protein
MVNRLIKNSKKEIFNDIHIRMIILISSNQIINI